MKVVKMINKLRRPPSKCLEGQSPGRSLLYCLTNVRAMGFASFFFKQRFRERIVDIHS